MNETKYLKDKTILYRLTGAANVYIGRVRNTEERGVWLEGGTLIEDLHRDAAWKPLIDNIKGSPEIFVPFSSLVFLLVEKEE